MNATLAAFHVVADYKGGAMTLAPMLGKNAATLSHEVNPNYGAAKLGLEDAIKLTLLTEDLRVLSAFAAQCGCIVLPMASADGVQATDESGLAAVSALASKFGDLMARVSKAMTAPVSANDMRAAEREAGELVAAVQVAVVNVRLRMEHGRAGVAA